MATMAFLKTLARPLLRGGPAPRALILPFSPAAASPLPSAGPLFPASPPWMLSQAATPLLFGGGARVAAEAAVLLRSEGRCADVISGSVAARSVVEEAAAALRLRQRRGERVEVQVPGSGIAAERFFNFPNLVSIARMVSGPVIGWMIINEWYTYAFGALVASGASDWLDGYLARKLGINSVVGSYLDPLADKVLIGCVAITMVERELLHPALVGLVVLRDVVLVGGSFYKRAADMRWQWKSWSDFVNLDGSHQEKVQPLFISKVNTVLQLLLVGAALIQPEFGTADTQQYITYLSWLVASTTVASSAGYGMKYLKAKP